MIRFKVENPAAKMTVSAERNISFQSRPASVVLLEAEQYMGEYAINPSWTKQTLPTKGKHLREDVVVNIIPVEKVSNAAGGKTVIIGG